MLSLSLRFRLPGNGLENAEVDKQGCSQSQQNSPGIEGDASRRWLSGHAEGSLEFLMLL
jgi:hypothetical protein